VISRRFSRLPAILLGVAVATQGAFACAAAPEWWTLRGVLNLAHSADDYGVLNQGQLKQFATHARNELEYQLPGGAGANVNLLIESWLNPPGPPAPQPDGYAAVNIGQLKNAAKVFYDRFAEINYREVPLYGLPALQTYPWSPVTADDNDFALATIGQAKFLFSFDPGTDVDGDYIASGWEAAFGMNPRDPSDALGDLDHDGLSNADEYFSGTNPTNSDSDGDGMRDGWEHAFGLDPLTANNPNADPDGDGLSNFAESQVWRNPNAGAVAGTVTSVDLRVFTTLR
jgi:hypothetical protein